MYIYSIVVIVIYSLFSCAFFCTSGFCAIRSALPPLILRLAAFLRRLFTDIRPFYTYIHIYTARGVYYGAKLAISSPLPRPPPVPGSRLPPAFSRIFFIFYFSHGCLMSWFTMSMILLNRFSFGVFRFLCFL